MLKQSGHLRLPSGQCGGQLHGDIQREGLRLAGLGKQWEEEWTESEVIINHQMFSQHNSSLHPRQRAQGPRALRGGSVPTGGAGRSED